MANWYRCGFSNCLCAIKGEKEMREHQRKEHRKRPVRDRTYWKITALDTIEILEIG